MPEPRKYGDDEDDLFRARSQLREGSITVQIPKAMGLHRRRPGSHFHPTPEFFLQTGGATDFVCPGGSFRLKTGQICIVPAGVPHAETPIDRRTPYSVLVVMQDRDGCIIIRGFADRERRISSHGMTPYLGGGHAFRCLEQVSLHHTIQRSLRGDYVTGLVDAFLVTVLTEISRPGSVRVPDCSLLVTEAEKLVRVDLAKPEMSVGMIATRLGCSPDHLTRRFRAERGMSLNIWITRERIQLACDLLSRLDYNIAEVGWACGFTSASYFIRVFKAHTGVTPRDWRAPSL
jgi:AraC-like DNA-binding protein